MTLGQDLHSQAGPREPAADSAPIDAQATVEPPPPPRAARWLERLAALSFSFLLFVACLYLYTRHNDFPHQYHADEDSKAMQILSWRSQRNFNHPQLLLETTEWAVRKFDIPADIQVTVEVGRWCSATFTAAGVIALAWVGYAAGGLMGMLIVGSVMGLSPQLLTYAHYMKEDAALTFGLMVMLLGARATWEAKRWWSKIPALVLLAAGVALAGSGKYAGLLAFAMAVPVALLAPRIRWYLRPLALVWMGVVAVGMLLLLNHRALNDWETFQGQWQAHRAAQPDAPRSLVDHGDALWRAVFRPDFRDGFGRERDHAITSHSGLTMDQPNTFFLSLFPIEVMPHALALAVLYVLIVLGTLIVRRRGWWGFWFIAFAAFYLAALSMSVIPFHRYFLPVSMMSYLAAGLALVWLVNTLLALLMRGWAWTRSSAEGPQRREPLVRVGLAGVVVLAVVAVQGARCVNYLEQFANDSRVEFRRWVAANLPANAVVLAEIYTGLRHPPQSVAGYETPALPQRLMMQTFAPQAGSLQRVQRGSRAEYVAICDLAYKRFFIPQVRPMPENPERIEYFRDWYEELEREHELVWSYEPSPNLHAFTNPGIKLYRLRR